jgi:NADH/NAD ratio-sensing transcriptional regulator Rex
MLRTGSVRLARKQIGCLYQVSAQRNSSSSSSSPIDNVIIIGSGLMGSGIAQSCAQSKHSFQSIVLQDVQQKALDNARNKMIANLTRLKQKNSKALIQIEKR